MYRFEAVRKAIDSIDGSIYQVMVQRLALVEYGLSKPNYLGTAAGTTKPAKGQPDSFYLDKNGNMVALVCGHYPNKKTEAKKKISNDIRLCLEKEKKLKDIIISRILCFYTYSRFGLSDIEELKAINSKIELIGPDEVAEAICRRHYSLAEEYLGLSAGNVCFYDAETFINIKDKDAYEATLKTEFLERERELDRLETLLNEKQVVIVRGRSGTGKTRLALEAALNYRKNAEIDLFCIKPGRGLLQNELSTYFSGSSKTLIFADDVNELSDFSSLIGHILIHENIQLLLTVRDYAAEKVMDEVRRTENHADFPLEQLPREATEKILRKQFASIPLKSIASISSIAKGNLRLAILAAKNWDVNNPYALDYKRLLEICYGNKLKSMDPLSRNAGEIAALLGPHLTKENRDLIDMLKSYNMSISDYIDGCASLCEEELMDMRQDYAAVAFEEQNLRDYFVFSAFALSKRVSLDSIWSLENGQSLFRRAMSILFGVFSDPDLSCMAEVSIASIWHTLPEADRCDFICDYGEHMKTEGLVYLRNQIYQLPEKDGDFSNIEKRNIRSINSDLLRCLECYLRGDTYNEAISLIFSYLDRNSEDVEGLIYIFSHSLIMTHDSGIVKFATRMRILDFLIERRATLKPQVFHECLFAYCASIWADDYTGEVKKDGKVFVAHGNCSGTLEELMRIRAQCAEAMLLVDKERAIDTLLAYAPRSSMGSNYEISKHSCQLIDEIVDCEKDSEISRVIAGSKLVRYAHKRSFELINLEEKLESSWSTRLIHQFLDLPLKSCETNPSNADKLLPFAESATEEELIELVSLLSGVKEGRLRPEWNIQYHLNEFIDILFKLDKDKTAFFCSLYIDKGCTASVVSPKICNILLNQHEYSIIRRKLIEAAPSDLDFWLSAFDEAALFLGKFEASRDDLRISIMRHGERLFPSQTLQIEGIYPGFYKEYLRYLLCKSKEENREEPVLEFFACLRGSEFEEHRKLACGNQAIAEELEQLFVYLVSRDRWVDFEDMGRMLVERNPSFMLSLFFDGLDYSNLSDNIEDFSKFLWESNNALDLASEIVDKFLNNESRVESFELLKLGRLFREAEKYEMSDIAIDMIMRLFECMNDSELIDIACCLSKNQKKLLLVSFAQKKISWSLIEKILITPSEYFESWSGSYVPVIEARIDFIEEVKSEFNSCGIDEFNIDFLALLDREKEAVLKVELGEFVDPFYRLSA